MPEQEVPYRAARAMASAVAHTGLFKQSSSQAAFGSGFAAALELGLYLGLHHREDAELLLSEYHDETRAMLDGGQADEFLSLVREIRQGQ